MGKERTKEMLFWTKEEYMKFIEAVADKLFFHRTRESAMQGGIVCISLRKNGSLINLACERRRASEIGITDSCNDLGAMA